LIPRFVGARHQHLLQQLSVKSSPVGLTSELPKGNYGENAFRRSAVANFVPVIAVLNMKGGVGKTTISSNVFRQLFARKKRSVLLIDLDPQFNLTQTLFTRAQYEKIKADNKTVFSIMEPPSDTGIFEIKTTSLPPPAVDSLAKELLHLIADKSKNISIIPGDFRLIKYSLMDHDKKLKDVRGRFLEFIEGAKISFDAVVIDCNPSSSFLTLCAVESCTHLLVPVRPDRYSILGLDMLWEFVHSLPLAKKPEFVIILNGVSRTELTDVESELRAHPDFGARTLASEIAISKVLSAVPSYTGFGTDRSVSWSSTIRSELNKVADELSNKIGLK
jgi:chromosome partitioning protein